MVFDLDAIRSRIETVLLDSGEFDPKQAFDIAFHMTDWLGDLQALIDFYSDPNLKSDRQVEALLTDFLIHAPEHLAAAKRLYVGFGVSDIFKAGAVISEDSEE